VSRLVQVLLYHEGGDGDDGDGGEVLLGANAGS
jgi:hypothetical protein